MSEGCSLCGVRRDIGCKHHPAEGSPPPAISHPKGKKDGRQVDRGQGHAFHRPPGNKNSLFGKAGNPTRREFQDFLGGSYGKLK